MTSGISGSSDSLAPLAPDLSGATASGNIGKTTDPTFQDTSGDFSAFSLPDNKSYNPPSSPSLPKPDDTQQGDIRAGKMTPGGTVTGNSWLSPSCLVALITVLMETMRQEGQYAFMEGQAVVRGMRAQEVMGQNEKELNEQIGREELTKGIVTGTTEIVNGAMIGGSTAMRVRALSRSGKGNPELAKQEEAIKTQKSAKDIEIEQYKTKNDKLNDKLNEKELEDDDYIGSGPQTPQQAQRLQAHEKAKQDIRDEINQNNHEITKLKSEKAGLDQRMAEKRLEVAREEAQVYEGIGRASEHLMNAAQRFTEGIQSNKIKILEGELALLRTHMDILKTYLQQSLKAEGEGNDQVKQISQAIDSMVSKYAESFKFTVG